MGGNAGIESVHITSGSPVDSWIFMEARGTVPPSATFAVVFEILVGQSGGGAMRFDDISMSLATTTVGWKNLGPVFPGNGNTNQVFDPIGGNKQEFYRVTTP
jgi:hypothetical protein